MFCLAEQGDQKLARRHTGAMPRRRRSRPSTIRRLLLDIVTLAGCAVTSRSQLVAENLFLRKQLALYQERRVKPRRPDPATRMVLVLLSRLLDWRALLMVVQPDTLIQWHRQGWRRLWRWRSRPGRPPIPRELQRLIMSMPRRTQPGVKNGSRANCSSNWDWPCRRARWVGTSGVYVRGTADGDPSVGRRLCEIMRTRSWPVTFSRR